MFSFEIPEHHVIVTASSDGFIKMWKLQQDKVGVLAQHQYTVMQVLLLYCLELSDMGFFLKGHRDLETSALKVFQV